MLSAKETRAPRIDAVAPGDADSALQICHF